MMKPQTSSSPSTTATGNTPTSPRRRKQRLALSSPSSSTRGLGLECKSLVKSWKQQQHNTRSQINHDFHNKSNSLSHGSSSSSSSSSLRCSLLLATDIDFLDRREFMTTTSSGTTVFEEDFITKNESNENIFVFGQQQQQYENEKIKSIVASACHSSFPFRNHDIRCMDCNNINWISSSPCSSSGSSDEENGDWMMRFTKGKGHHFKQVVQQQQQQQQNHPPTSFPSQSTMSTTTTSPTPATSPTSSPLPSAWSGTKLDTNNNRKLKKSKKDRQRQIVDEIVLGMTIQIPVGAAAERSILLAKS